ncbi:MAG: OmpH family outer membrane protein [Candidatus Aureabacteria bacterium]|nr:OmpH family outer membrane protein [Candidatus Auribacterota bacterium]
MEHFKSSIRIAMALLLAFSLFGLMEKKALCEEGLKIGYVNFEKIFESYDKTKELNEELQKKKYSKEVEGQQMVDEINKLRNEMQLLSEEVKEQKQKELTDKMRDLRDFTNDSKQELLKERDELFKDLTKEIVVVIEEKGKKDGYTIIFDDQVLLYKAKANDLTEDIIKMLNEKFKQEKAASEKK